MNIYLFVENILALSDRFMTLVVLINEKSVR